MLTKFKVSSEEIRTLIDTEGSVQPLNQTDVDERFYKDILDITTGTDGVIDGNQLQTLNFPSLRSEYDIFISYSHNDDNEALYLASWLNNKCGLSCFLDSTVWHSADALLKEIDGQYCWQPKRNTYNYKRRNFSTSHIHAMLSMAILDIINRSECCIVIDSDQSMPIKDGIERCTLSPWIYEEVAFITHIRPNLPDRFKQYTLKQYSEGGQLYEAKENQPLKIKYNVNISSFPSLQCEDLIQLAEGHSALDNLYLKKKVFNYN